MRQCTKFTSHSLEIFKAYKLIFSGGGTHRNAKDVAAIATMSAGCLPPYSLKTFNEAYLNVDFGLNVELR